MKKKQSVIWKKIYNKMDLKEVQMEFPDITINSPHLLMKYLSTYAVALDFLK